MEIKTKISNARDEIFETMSKLSNASNRSASMHSHRTDRSRMKSIGPASIFSAARSVRHAPINTPSEKLTRKLAELDEKEREINDRKARIKTLLNQELNATTNVPNPGFGPGAIKPPHSNHSLLNKSLPDSQ